MIKKSGCISAILMLIVAVPAPGLAARRRPKARITPAQCRMLLTTPAVPGPAYEPGVDVNGHPVAPADLTGGPPLGAITIDLRTLLGQVPGVQVPSILSASEIREGRIRIGLEHGDVKLNGHPLGPGATAAVRAACRKAGVRR